MAENRELAMVESEEPLAANGAVHAASHGLVRAESDATSPMAPMVLDYLNSPNGHQLANRTLDLLESIKKATLDEQAKTKAQQNELAKLGLKHTLLLQTIGLFAVVGAIVGLSATGQLRGEAATILGAMAGYLFAQQKKSDG